MSHSFRFLFPPFSIAAVHFRQKRTSFSQCLPEKAGTSSASGESIVVQGLSANIDPMMLKTSAVSLP